MAKLKRKQIANTDDSVAKTKRKKATLEATTEVPIKKLKIKQKKLKAKNPHTPQKKVAENAAPLGNDDNDDVDEGDDEGDLDGIQEPSLDELKASERPENLNAIVTGRQKKRQKHQQRLAEQKDHNCGKEKQRNEEYLSKWKHRRSEWKFEKLRQISIQQTVFDEEKITAATWPLALEYLSGSKGAAKEKITKLAEQLIEKLDRDCETQQGDNANDKSSIIDSVQYRRARDLLQSFD